MLVYAAQVLSSIIHVSLDLHIKVFVMFLKSIQHINFAVILPTAGIIL